MNVFFSKSVSYEPKRGLCPPGNAVKLIFMGRVENDGVGFMISKVGNISGS